MAPELLERIAVLKAELAEAESAGASQDREVALDHLEQAVRGLEGLGREAPRWAQKALEARYDRASEDFFDNLPI